MLTICLITKARLRGLRSGVSTGDLLHDFSTGQVVVLPIAERKKHFSRIGQPETGKNWKKVVIIF